jgi:hypothetical protein
MDRQPGEQIPPQPLVVEHGKEGAQDQPVVKGQDEAWRGPEHPQRKGQDGDLRVVGKQHGGKGAQRIAGMAAAIIERAAQGFGAGGGGAAIGQIGRHEGIEPRHILTIKCKPGQRAQHHGQKPDQQRGARCPHRLRDAGDEQPRKQRAQRFLRGIDHQPGPGAQPVEVIQQPPIQRDVARHRQR